MKTHSSYWSGQTKRVSFCSAGLDERQQIEIAGRTLIPDADSAYVEFYLSHCWPVVNKYRTAILPQVVANSYATLQNKVFNLAHLMRKYNPEKIARDRILGTVVAVEFVDGAGDAITDLKPEGGFLLAPAPAVAQGIRAVAVMHKAAEGVVDILGNWFTGDKKWGEWSVSIENSFDEEACGFLVRGGSGLNQLADFVADTPAELTALDYIYVPCLSAPRKLLECLNNAADDERDGYSSTRICRDYHGCETLFLLGGLNNAVRYRGVGLAPANTTREAEARVANMLASAPVVDAAAALEPFRSFGTALFEKK